MVGDLTRAVYLCVFTLPLFLSRAPHTQDACTDAFVVIGAGLFQDDRHNGAHTEAVAGGSIAEQYIE